MAAAHAHFTGWARGIGFTAGAALFLLASGCHSGNREGAEIPKQEPVAPVAPPVAESTKPTVAPLTLVGPRSQEDLAECFALPKNVTFNSAAHSGAASGTSNYAPSGPVTAGAGWDVKLARDWKYIVIHHSASAIGSASIFDRAHKARGWDGLGYDFVIGNGEGSGDGQVEVGYRWVQQARGAHAGNMDYNEHGIGICLVGNFEDTRPTAKQLESLHALVKFLMAKTGIPAANIIGHGDVPGKDTRCPGKLFDMASFRVSMGGKGSSTLVAQDAPRPAPASTTHPAATAKCGKQVMP
ncbi:MAG: N-acetylmuramoyl-L-alanine amidase [Planctomycetes bacterium]|nr:N-acetylmuramoyl-L-alanine amidase [Planctomycetota bacterium]